MPTHARRIALLAGSTLLAAAAVASATGRAPANIKVNSYAWHAKRARLVIVRGPLSYRIEARRRRDKDGWHLHTRLTTTSADGRAHLIVDGSLHTKCVVAVPKGRTLVLGYTRIRMLGGPPTLIVTAGHPAVETDRTSVGLGREGSIEVTVAVLPRIVAGAPASYGQPMPLATVRLEVDARGQAKRIGIRRAISRSSATRARSAKP